MGNLTRLVRFYGCESADLTDPKPYQDLPASTETASLEDLVKKNRDKALHFLARRLGLRYDRVAATMRSIEENRKIEEVLAALRAQKAKPQKRTYKEEKDIVQLPPPKIPLADLVAIDPEKMWEPPPQSPKDYVFWKTSPLTERFHKRVAGDEDPSHHSESEEEKDREHSSSNMESSDKAKGNKISPSRVSPRGQHSNLTKRQEGDSETPRTGASSRLLGTEKQLDSQPQSSASLIPTIPLSQTPKLLRGAKKKGAKS